MSLLLGAVLASVVGLVSLMTVSQRPSRTMPATGLLRVATQEPQPSLIVTQFVAGGPLVVANLTSDGSIVVVTQYPATFIASSFVGPTDLGLYDFRYRPEIGPEKLK